MRQRADENGAGVAFAVLFLPQGFLGLLKGRKAAKVPSLGEGGKVDELPIDDPSIDLLRPIRQVNDARSSDGVMLAISHLKIGRAHV